MQFDTGHRVSEGLRVSTLARWHSAYEQFQDSLLCSACSIPILKREWKSFSVHIYTWGKIPLHNADERYNCGG